MLFQEKQPEETEKNLYPWPKCYYMESEPEKRRQLLDAQLSKDGGEEIRRMEALFRLRYEKDKQGKYADAFLRGWLELLMLRDMIHSRFAGKKNRATASAAARRLCLDREEEFGREVLYDELCHLAGVYIVTCRNDARYQSVILGYGRMREEKLTAKIRDDLRAVADTVPAALGMEETFSLFSRAVRQMEERML